LNQPLTALSNNASAGLRFLERGNVEPAFLREIFEDMVHDTRRAREVIRGVRAMARKDKSAARTALDLNALIADTLRLVSTDIAMRESVVRTELDENLPQVEAAPVQMQQVMINLIMNALDATESVSPRERRIVINTHSDNGDVHVSIRDFGMGLPKDDEEKVFDHFFSTKKAGMGMGLTIVRSIIETHGGKISAENARKAARFFPSVCRLSQRIITCCCSVRIRI
jgi:C4-dicarboxylate-specific signal transduction histidine kinase